MVRQVSSALFALLLTIAAMLAAAGPAAASEVHYRAQPAAAPAAARLIVRDTVWRCGSAGCVAPRSGSRPAIVCASVARALGTLRGFSAGGEAFDAEALENCNRRAR
ncbi:MAG TPA: hypothetical protein VF577_06000 [Allosphingosinicella sp.]|jgi:hypothetical protein